MHALDERVLRDDEPAGELRGVVLDPPREAAPLELGQEAELAQVARASSPPGRARRPVRRRPDPGEAAAHGPGRDLRRLPRGRLEVEPPGEQRGQRRRMRAAGAVRGAALVARDRDLHDLLAVEERVDRLVAVTSRDDHRLRPERVQAAGQQQCATLSRRSQLIFVLLKIQHQGAGRHLEVLDFGRYVQLSDMCRLAEHQGKCRLRELFPYDGVELRRVA